MLYVGHCPSGPQSELCVCTPNDVELMQGLLSRVLSNILNPEMHQNDVQNSVNILQTTNYFTITKTNSDLKNSLCCCGNRTDHTNTPCGQDTQF
jgi:hypothetical protein